MLIIASFTVMAFGFLCVYDREFAWTLFDMDARMFRGKSLTKSPKWERELISQGLALIVLGGVGVIISMQLL